METTHVQTVLHSFTPAHQAQHQQANAVLDRLAIQALPFTVVLQTSDTITLQERYKRCAERSAGVWLLSNPARYSSSQFLRKWLNTSFLLASHLNTVD